MTLAILINMLWILWTVYTFFTGFEIYEGIHSHAYAYFFFIGVWAVLLGSVYLKFLHFRNRPTPWVQLGFGLWLFGFLMYLLCVFTGSHIPGAHLLKEHVIFNHPNYLIYLAGMMVSVYLDTLIVSRLGWKRAGAGTNT